MEDLRKTDPDELEQKVIAHIRGYVLPTVREIPPSNVIQFKSKEDPEDLVA
jgi:hypothetical protein